MMRVVFAHDHVFSRYRSRYFSPGRLPYTSWHRYLAQFNEVVVLARVQEVESEKLVVGMQRSDGPGVAFVDLRPVRGLGRVLRGASRERQLINNTISAADAVVARVPSEIGLTAAAAAQRALVPVAFEVVASAWHSLWHHGDLISKLYAPVLEWRTRRTVANGDFALYVTREYLQSKYPCAGATASASNVTVAVDAEVIRRRLLRIDAHAKPLVLGFVGSLQAAYKGLDIALQALQIVIRDGMDVRLQIVGEGPTRAWRTRAVRLGIDSHLEFKGSLPGSAAVQSWLDGVDIYIHPSRAEGLPRSLIEAMSRGCLCFGSRVGGIPELLDGDQMHRVADARGLAELIKRGAVSQHTRVDAAITNPHRAENYEASRLEQARADFFRSVADEARAMASPPPPARARG